jgi:hypothetical protein
MQRDQVSQYLSAIFSAKPPDAWICIWSIAPDQSKISRWAQSVDDAVSACAAAGDGSDIFVAMGVTARAFGASSKTRIDTVTGIGALYVDIDIAGAGHKGDASKLPADQAAALALVEKIGVAPSMVINTGGGIHAYWLLKEFWTFDSLADKKRAVDLNRGWQRTIQAHAKAIGRRVDGTFDLARVLRVPGTFNNKVKGQPRECRIIAPYVDTPAVAGVSTGDDLLRYDAADLEPFVSARADDATQTIAQVASEVSQASGLIVFLPNAQPDTTAFDSLYDNSDVFRLTWDHNRHDISDSSDSGYDMALAHIAVQSGWPDQQIVDLLLAHRAKYGARAHPNNYYVETIAKCRTRYDAAGNPLHGRRAERAQAASSAAERTAAAQSALSINSAPAELICIADADDSGSSADSAGHIGNVHAIASSAGNAGELVAIDTAPAPGDAHAPSAGSDRQASPSARQASLDFVRTMIGTPILRVFKFATDPPRYQIVTSSGKIDLPNVSALVTQSTLRDAIAAAQGYLIHPIKADDWHTTAQELLNACETVNVGPEGSDEGEMRAWLVRYFDDNPPMPLQAETAQNQTPFTRNDEPSRVYLFVSHFREWLMRREAEKLTGKAAGVRLRKVGAAPHTVTIANGDPSHKFTRNVWYVNQPDARRNGQAGKAVETHRIDEGNRG